MTAREHILFGLALIYSSILVLLSTAIVVLNVFQPSIQAIVDLVIVLFLLLPVWFTYKRLESFEESVRSDLWMHRSFVGVVLILLSISTGGYLYGWTVPGLWALHLSFRVAAQALIPLQQVLMVLPGGAEFVLQVGRWTIHIVWIVLLTSLGSDLIRPVRDRISGFSDTTLTSRFIPIDRHPADASDTISIYVVTGLHGVFWVPHSFCTECHTVVSAAEEAIETVDGDVSLSIRSWWSWLPWALLHRGYYPPCLYVNGELVTQGEAVPSVEDIVAALDTDDA